MPPRPQITSDTRARIVEAARHLFWEKGYAAAGLAEMLERAGANSGSFYHFFESKDEILRTVLDTYVALLEPNRLNPIAEIGRRLFRLETHTPEEKPFTPRELQAILAEQEWEIVRWTVEVTISFAASRICRLTEVPARLRTVLAILLEVVEDASERCGFAARFGWIIQCLAKRGD